MQKSLHSSILGAFFCCLLADGNVTEAKSLSGSQQRAMRVELICAPSSHSRDIVGFWLAANSLSLKCLQSHKRSWNVDGWWTLPVAGCRSTRLLLIVLVFSSFLPSCRRAGSEREREREDGEVGQQQIRARSSARCRAVARARGRKRQK